MVFMQGAALWARLSASHGYFNKQGYCDGGNTLGAPSGNCHLFPVIWGEAGTGFTVSYISPSVPQTHRPPVVVPAVMQHQGCSDREAHPHVSSSLLSRMSSYTSAAD